MKKTFLLLFLVLFSICAGYSFEIQDSQGAQRNFFSLSDSVVSIYDDSNETLEVSYTLNSQETLLEYNLTQCDDDFCIELDLLTLFDSDNSSTTIPNEFDFSISNETKTVYLDVVKPDISIIDEVLNASLNQVEVEFTYSDNSNSFSLVELLVKENSNYVFDRVLNSTSFVFELNEQEEFDYQIRVIDEAGNSNSISSSIEVGDIYEPILEEFVYTLKESTYYVEFEISDDTQLASYAFTQGSVSLEEDISGITFEKTVTLPFTKGDVSLVVFDENNNSFSRTFSLIDDISISSVKRYSNKEEFSFTSNANSCSLIEVDGSSDTSSFTKSGSTFKVDVDVQRFEDVLISFSCINDGFKKYFEKEFFYDTSSPEDIELTLEEKDNGEIYLEWTQSQDDHLDVRYILYRDGDEIYEGSKTRYEDDDVEYPQTYDYYVEVVDLAGNSEESAEIEGTPLKTDIEFFVSTSNNQVVQDSKFFLKGALEDGATLEINVKYNGNLIHTKSLKGNSNDQFSTQVLLEEGLNSIEFLAQDELGNSKNSYLYVTYEPVIVAHEENFESTVNNNVVQEEVIVPNTAVIEKEDNSTLVEEEVVVEKDTSYWLWFLIFLILLIVFIYIIFTKEDELREKFKRKTQKISNHYSKSRKEDVILGKNLEKAKQERIKKQEQEREKKRKEEEAKKRKKESEYQKQKLKELSEKKEVHFSDLSRKKAQRRVNKIKRESSYEEELEKIKEEKPQKSIFGTLFAKSKPEEKKEDELSSYVQSQKSRKSWNDTYSYRSSYVEQQKAQEEAKRKAAEEEKKLQELKTQEELSKRQAAEDKKRKEEDIINRETSSEEFIKKSKEKRVDLDDYLGQRTKKKRWFFAEREVERDLKSRK